MIKRFVVVCFSLLFILQCTTLPCYACDEKISEDTIAQIIFGDDALKYQSNEKYSEKYKILMDAIYLCCEQSNNQGQKKIDYLKTHKIRCIPSLSKINVKQDCLMDCTHTSWESTYVDASVKDKRKKILNKSVNKVFDFGLFNNWFGSQSGECESFSALLYYSHILSDYLTNDPSETETNFKGKHFDGYSGIGFKVINNDKPSFSSDLKTNLNSRIEYSGLDSLGRAGTAYAVLSKENVSVKTPRENMTKIKPVGFQFDKYPKIVNSGMGAAYLFNRCHLIAHSFGGVEEEKNLITGTRYLNADLMKEIEDEVNDYLKHSDNHVLYRVTPVYNKDNLVATGVLMEAYSVEDNGDGISYNRFCYNVQPGVRINYANGKNEKVDVITYEESALPFVEINPNDVNLIDEMNKHLKVLFDKGETKITYDSMMSDINSVKARTKSVSSNNENEAKRYMQMKEIENEYFNILKRNIPQLLQKSDFFKTAFN